MTEKSLNALLEFLEWTSDKGLMAKNTVGGRKAAASKVLGVLDPEEQADVTAVDLDSAMTRFINLHGKDYTTSSLNVYKSRTNAAINDFQTWLNDPLSFKPQSNKTEKSAGKKPPKKSTAVGRPQPDTPSATFNPQSHSTAVNVFPIQIRENLVIRIHGLPFDLSKAEADRIANVIKAMAME
jgi:hypothetical protein